MVIILIKLSIIKGYRMNIIGELLGYIAGVCTAICFLPQTIKTIRSKNVNGLSFASYIIYCTGILSWILYGFYLSSIQMIIFNAISLVFAGTILYMIVKNWAKRNNNKKVKRVSCETLFCSVVL